MPVSYLQQPYLLRASKTFTGAANLGAVGVNELFTVTGTVLIERFLAYVSTTLSDTVDGALFGIETAAYPSAFFSGGAFDLDLAVTGTWLHGTGVGADLAANYGGLNADISWPVGLSANIIMTISTQAITGGVLEFYVLWRPLSADGNLAIGAGMVAI